MNHRLSSLFLIILGIFACDDNNAPKSTGEIVAPVMDAYVPINQVTPDMMTQTPPVDMMVVTPSKSKELQIQGDIRRGALYGERLDLSVKYIEQISGQMPTPLANQALTMKILNAMNQDVTDAGVNGSRIQNRRANTNAQGLATFTLFAGEQDATFKLEVNAPEASPVAFNITVSRPTSGNIKVKVTYNTNTNRYEYANFSDLQVHLFEGRVLCDTLVANINRVNNAYFSFLPLTPFNDVNNTVSDVDYAHGAIYTVLAILNNNVDPMIGPKKAIAYGCVEQQVIQGGRELLVEIAAKDLPLEYKGRYTSTNKFDLTDFLSTSGDPTLSTIADVMNILRLIGSADPDSGSELVRLLCEIGNVDAGVCNIASTIGGPILYSFIRNIDPNILRIFEVISDVLSIVAEMTIIGELEFSGNQMEDMNNNMALILTNNANRWLKFRFYWRNGCPPNTDCVREFTIGNLNSLRDPIEGVFDATVTANHVSMSAHGLVFKYGLIALGLAETWIFPAILGRPGPISLSEVLNGALLNACQQAVSPIFGQQGAMNSCSTLLNALAVLVEAQLSSLDFAPENFVVQGEADSKDENFDLLIDQLINGIWNLTITINNTPIESMGCFVACRDGECPSNLGECEIPMVMVP
jgi:hypothetical protein